MATSSSLCSLFENPLPENPTLIESLTSLNQQKPAKPLEFSSFAEIFGELYFQEKPTPPPPLEPKNVLTCENPSSDSLLGYTKNRDRCILKSSGVFSTKDSESLQLCTEGLGSESSDDVDDLLDSGNDWRTCVNGVNGYSRCCMNVKSPKNRREFPPPITSIGKSGKPRICLKSYREDGRFVLREIRIPNQELLHASREDGRLKLHFVRPNEDIAEEEAGGEEEDDDDGVQEMEKGEMDEEEKKIVCEGDDHQL